MSAGVPNDHAGDAAGATAAVRVDDASQVGEARRAAAALAARLGFGDADAGRVALAATEAATNLARHAKGGVLLVQAAPALEGGRPGVDLIALDRGPGIPDVRRVLADGVSTAGTPGRGLGAMRRAADVFDIHSAGAGTVVVARCWPDAAARHKAEAPEFVAGGVAVPLAGEQVCGDAWAAARTAHGCRVLVADGLGHGPAAAEASQLAVRLFRDDAAREDGSPLTALLEQLHGALRATRGAAVAVADVRAADREVRYCAVGNIAASVTAADGTARHLVSHNGTVGHAMRRAQEFVYPWPDGGALALHSDGLRPRWRLADVPGLARCHPAAVAAALWRDHARGSDDASAVVLRARRDGERA